MKNKQSSVMITSFFPGVFLGAVIGFIFGALLVARLADDLQYVAPTADDTVAEVVYDGSFREDGCTESATIVTETLDSTELRHRIYLIGESAVDVTTEDPMTMQIFDAVVPGATFVGFTPSGVGGYIPYAGPSFLYRVDHCTGEATMVTPFLFEVMITDVSEDGTLAAFVSQGTALTLGVIPAIVDEAIDGSTPAWAVPGDYALIGDAIISPDNQRIAFAVANGPDNEESEVMLLDTATGVFTSVAKSGAILHVNGWNENGTVDYSE